MSFVFYFLAFYFNKCNTGSFSFWSGSRKFIFLVVVLSDLLLLSAKGTEHWLIFSCFFVCRGI